jgi:hypothetical protein
MRSMEKGKDAGMLFITNFHAISMISTTVFMTGYVDKWQIHKPKMCNTVPNMQIYLIVTIKFLEKA